MMKLYLRKSNCTQSDRIRALMLDPLWSLVQVEFITSTEPFLETTTGSIIHDPETIVSHLLTQAQIAPSVLDQLRNAHRAAIKAYKHVIKTGQIQSPPELATARRAICAECPFNQIKWRVNRCTQCGCSIKAKTATLSESCPLKKW